MKNNKILVFSYYTNMPGACQAEWVDDRINAFIEKGFNISIVSATCCFKHEKNDKIKHLRTPTLSPHGCRYEYEEIQRRNIPVEKSSFIFRFLKFMTKIDFLFERIKLKSGEGRWSWFISSFFVSFKLDSLKSYDFIFTTGGPASAHLTGILLGKIYGKKVICEFQDPLSGKDIGRNRLSQIGLKFFERLIIKNADCTIYCTKNAMVDARNKYQKFASKIFYIYPGAEIVQKDITKVNMINDSPKKINITYLGSLYQTRNLDTLMIAIDELVKEGYPILSKLEINLYGNINKDILLRINQFKYELITIHGLVSRSVAMEKAQTADVLLLIQNTDDRSIVTIPFKTYDYLHTGKLILGLTYRNNELQEMLLSHGHLVCQADDIVDIKSKLLLLVFNFQAQQSKISESIYTPLFAVNKMLQLIKAS